MRILKITHNAGFFSCCTIRLIEIMKFYNAHGCLPDVVDSTEQFAFFKKDETEDITGQFFQETNEEIAKGHHEATYCPGEISFGDYSQLIYQNITPFINRYFTPSEKVKQIIQGYEQDYQIDFSNTCAVFYRGNDKQRECDITPYQQFIDKAKLYVKINPHIKFLVQPDETEFLEAFTSAFPGRCFWFKETPHMRRKNSAIFYELPAEKKTDHGCYFLAAVITMAKCNKLLTHSGNGGMWAVLYRGSFDGVTQFMANPF